MNRFVPTVVRNRPRTTVLLILFVALILAAAAFYYLAQNRRQEAQKAVAEGKLDEARDCLKTCLMIWPRSPSVHLLAARVERLSGHFSEAESHLNLCLKLQPNATADVELEFLLMRVQRGEVDAVAAPLLQCVEERHRESALILETLSQAYLHNLRYGPALSCIERWIQDRPDMAQPYYLRGWMRERLADRKGAASDFLSALERKPDFVLARLRLVEMYLQSSQGDEALPHLQRLREQFPDRADIAARLGHCRFLLGDMKEARRLMESAVEKLPDDLSLLIQMGRLENAEGRPSKAEQWLQRALKIDPTDPEAQFLLANTLEAQGRAEEAEVVRERYRKTLARLKRVNHLLEEAAGHTLADPNALYDIGSLFLQSGQEHLGLYWLHRALEEDAAHLPTHRALLEHYEKKKDHEGVTTHRRWIQKARGDKDEPNERR